ncbi:MAG: carbohydrate ABC transporter permease, partial [Eubacteriales bacterium]|nr:carbohydrate ABC transporter permease [Eubacteriales bacterium]
MSVDHPVKTRLASFSLVTLLVIISVVALMPFLFIILSSFKPGVEMVRNGLSLNLDFQNFSLTNYGYLFTQRDGVYLDWYKNSILITVLQTAGGLFLSSMVGYALAKYDFKGRTLVFVLVLIVMMIPIEILLLPLYKLSITLRTINTYQGVFLPFLVSMTGIFFFRQYAIGLPKELMEAGRIDGCTEYGIYFKIMMPLMKPAFGALTILMAMGSWNSFVWPLIVMRDNVKLTLPVGLQTMLTPYGNNYDMLMSGAVLAVLPILIVFLFNQKS